MSYLDTFAHTTPFDWIAVFILACGMVCCWIAFRTFQEAIKMHREINHTHQQIQIEIERASRLYPWLPGVPK